MLNLGSLLISQKKTLDKYLNEIHYAFHSSDNKMMMKTSAVHSLIATQNWIIKVSSYSLNIVHQSDTALIAIQVHIQKSFIYDL